MLADLSLVGCYNMSTVPEKKRAQLLLESAKKNLRDMAFFGLTEYQRKTQFLFERTFRLRFIRPFMQYNSTRAAGVDLDNATVRLRAQQRLGDLAGRTAGKCEAAAAALKEKLIKVVHFASVLNSLLNCL